MTIGGGVRKPATVKHSRSRKQNESNLKYFGLTRFGKNKIASNIGYMGTWKAFRRVDGKLVQKPCLIQIGFQV